MLLLKRPQVELPGLMHCVSRLQVSVECVRGASMPPPRGWKLDSPKTLQGAAFSGPGGPATGLLCVPPAGSAGAFSRQQCPELPVCVALFPLGPAGQSQGTVFAGTPAMAAP